MMIYLINSKELDLFDQSKIIDGKLNLSDQLKRINTCYKKKLDMRQSACLVVNSITVIATFSSLIIRQMARP